MMPQSLLFKPHFQHPAVVLCSFVKGRRGKRKWGRKKRWRRHDRQLQVQTQLPERVRLYLGIRYKTTWRTSLHNFQIRHLQTFLEVFGCFWLVCPNDFVSVSDAGHPYGRRLLLWSTCERLLGQCWGRQRCHRIMTAVAMTLPRF